jgi:16S rRNA (guanine527-N7)-methyltransferase
VVLPGDLPDRLTAYYELLARWNRKINLTALDNVDEAIDRLLLEPVIAARYLPLPTARVLDIGSGGGSPAIPLKLTVPDIHMRMVEVKARKSAFLREAVRQLGLDNTQVETARYEELLARPELHEDADAVTLRAVRVEPRVLTTLQAFLAEGGLMLLFRGLSGTEAVPAVPPLEWTVTVPLLDATRSRLSVLTKRVVGSYA